MSVPLIPPDDLGSLLPDGIEVVRFIGGGGQRKVYEARIAGRSVALKIMTSDDATVTRAEREIASGLGRRHPHLAEVFDDSLSYFESGHTRYSYFTEELVEGDTLVGAMGGWEACEVLRLAEHLVRAVDALWSGKIVHRDINPKNIIKNADRGYVLVDVGVGRHQQEDSITQGLHVVGTPGYMSPEQLHWEWRRELNFKSDLFLIGIVLHEALTGKVPFDPNSEAARVSLYSGEFYFADMNGVPEPLNRVLARLLGSRPHQRYRTCQIALERIGESQRELKCF